MEADSKNIIKFIVTLLLKLAFLVTISVKIPSEDLTTEITRKRRNMKSSLLTMLSLSDAISFQIFWTFSTALHNFFDIGTAQKNIPKYWFKYVDANFFFNADGEKHSSKDFQMSEKGREVDQC